ncbi:MAG: hypothetical protein HY659_04730 [Rhizobiales bacterium]|nr:hypothetical protein [Hyphomicrobiales bacterium]
MPTDKMSESIAFTVVKENDGWFIALPDESQVGPYYNAAIALEVAVTHALLARNQGLDAQVLVRDDYGGTHKCMMIDWCGGPGRCVVCESLWPMSPHTLRCPVRAAIHAT